jgi:O-antigen ligase
VKRPTVRSIVRYLQEADWQRIAEWSVLVLIVLSILWRGGKGLEMTWLLAGVASCITIIDWWKGSEKKQISMALWACVIGLIIWTALSYSTSMTKNYGFDEVMRTAALGLIFLWCVRRTAVNGSARGSFAEQVMLAIAGATVIACVIGVAVYIFQPVNRFVGTFFDYRFHTHYWPNAWAEYLLLAWPIVLWWLFSRSNNRPLFLRLIIMGFVIASFALSYSRGAAITFVAESVLWVWIIWSRAKKNFSWKILFRHVILVACITLVFFGTFNLVRQQFHDVQSVREKITFTADEGKSSVSERAQFWGHSMYFMYKKPLLGWGPYSFRFVQPRLQQDVLATSDHAHNVFLKLAAERGIIAAVLLATLIGFILVVSEHTLVMPLSSGDKKKRPRWLQKLGIVFLRSHGKSAKTLNGQFAWHSAVHVGVAGIVIHNLIDFNLQFVGIALPLWVLLALLAGGMQKNGWKMKSKKIVQSFELGIAVLLLLIAFIEGGFLMLSSVGRHAEAAGNTSIALRFYSWSEGEWFSRDLQLSRTKLLFEDQRLHEAQMALDDYFTRNKEDYRAWKLQGDIYYERQDFEKAYEAYQAAYERGGRYNDLDVTNGLIRSLEKLKRRPVIDERRQEFDSLLSTFEAAIGRNAHFVALTPNVEALVTLSSLLANIYYKDAPYYQVLSARADHHAKLERERISAQAPGYLW